MSDDQLRALRIFCASTGADFDIISQTIVSHRFEIEGADENFDGTLRSLRLMAVGRFGNRVWQILNTMLVARHLGVRAISFDDVSALGDFPGNIEGYQISATPRTG